MVLDQDFFIDVRFLTGLWNIQIFQVFGDMWKRNMFGFTTNIWGVTKELLWGRHGIFMLGDNVLEVEHENFKNFKIDNSEREEEILS